MKRAFTVMAMLAACLAVTSAQQPARQVTYLDAEKFAALAAKGGALANGPDFTASVAKRNKPGQVEIPPTKPTSSSSSTAPPRSSRVERWLAARRRGRIRCSEPTSRAVRRIS